MKDFDIQKEAGGVSYRAVTKHFRFEVSENYLEIHLFWAGKGTCCIPVQGTYGPLIQAIHAIPGKTMKLIWQFRCLITNLLQCVISCQEKFQTFIFEFDKVCLCFPDFIPTVSNEPPSSENNRTGLIVGIVVGVGVVSFLSVFLIFYIIKRRKRHHEDEGKYL